MRNTRRGRLGRTSWVLVAGAVVVFASGAAPAAAGPQPVEPAVAGPTAPDGLPHQGEVQVFAGLGRSTTPSTGDGGPAAAAGLALPVAVAHDGQGMVYIADQKNQDVRRVDLATGQISTVWGLPDKHDFCGQPGMIVPGHMAADAAGDLFLVDECSHSVLERTADGLVRALTGPGSTGPQSSIAAGGGVALDAAGDLFVSDPYGGEIDELTVGGAFHRIAGGNGPGEPGDWALATSAHPGLPGGMTVAPDGTVYVLALGARGQLVQRIGTDGVLTPVVGGGTTPLDCNGVPARDADLDYAHSLELDNDGRLLITESNGSRVLRLEPDGTLTTVLGRGDWVAATTGAPAATTSVAYPLGLDVLPDGRTLVSDGAHGRVLAFAGDTPGLLTAYAGTGVRGWAGDEGDGGQACTAAALAYPTGLATAPDGSTYVADYLNSQVRRITAAGVITVVAGTGRPGYGGDGGPGTLAQLDRPRAVAIDPAGRVLIADNVNNRVRRLDPQTGTITTVAGTGTWGSSGDGGSATLARLAGPHGLAVGADGTVWIADTGNARVRRIDPVSGTISTVAGTGTRGAGGDGGPAVAAQLSAPRALAVDATALYLSDPGTSSVRRIAFATGRISTLTGPSTGRPLALPASLLMTSRGLLVAVSGSGQILRLDLATGAATAVAGSPVPGSTAGAPARALAVGLSEPQGLANGPGGSVLVADTGHHRLLRLSPG